MNDDSLLIHQPTRLRIMAALSTLEEGTKVDFTFLSDELEVTEGNLSSHIRKLEEAGLLNVEKVFVDRKPKTWLALTERGRKAFAEYVRELERIVRSDARTEP
ncbi:Transcriptional regulator [uncultured spirochete]|jgi:DNA-binding MarR family transcriptional regulator|uniref:Transcriptional regulator n=1 Tax=uncultured spirochete TaxID=156406 RepID=A0A3P3XM77_9SPIR|nr:Transcriptional regulator [uncultured spirochete]